MRSAEWPGCLVTSPGALAHEHRPRAARCRVVVVSRSMQLHLAETDGHNAAARFVRQDGRRMGGFEGFDGCMDALIFERRWLDVAGFSWRLLAFG